MERTKGGEKISSLDMKGPYDLTTQKIDEIITQTSAGNYALGYVSDSTFYVKYVGRSDDDVNERLKKWVGKKSKYKKFKISLATSPKVAFEKECKNYHDFGGSEKLDNEKHPERPDNADWKCPMCNTFE
jgi:hypothetical protein